MSDIVKTFPHSPFELHAPYEPSGDQPQAIEELNEGLESGLAFQTLLGVTGSGKTFTMANVIARQGVPALIMAPNKTLAAQLYSEMREFFPNNAVEYFVSYYDYYQPEAYVPSRDLFIEKIRPSMSISSRCVWLPPKAFLSAVTLLSWPPSRQFTVSVNRKVTHRCV